MHSSRSSKSGRRAKTAVSFGRSSPQSRPHTNRSSTRTWVTSEMSIPIFNDDDDDDIEDNLYNITYPDLPPVRAIRRGICREAVRHGIEYNLPVDMGRMTSEHVYRLDLRSRFQQPYISLIHEPFDDERVRALSRLHHRPNTVQTTNRREAKDLLAKYRPQYTSDDVIRRVGASLSKDSRKTIETYCRTGPNNKNLMPPNRLRCRSQIYLPIESVKSDVQDRAQQILKDLDIELNEDFYKSDEEDKETVTPLKVEAKQVKAKQEEAKQVEAKGEAEKPAEDTEHTPENESPPKTDSRFKFEVAGLKSYEEFKKMGKKYRPPLPASAKSPFLSDSVNGKVWNWLTEDQVVDSFDYFVFLTA